MGVASVERWKDPPFQPWMPEEFYPQSIYPEARSVIVIGLPVSLPVLETSPSILLPGAVQYCERLAGPVHLPSGQFSQ